VSESSSSPGRHERPFDAEAFARQAVRVIETGDAYASVIERRVILLEEIVAARWPRSWLLRRRLRREIRASVATWDPEYIPKGDFYARRLAAASDEADGIIARQERARAEGWPEPGGHGDEGTDPGAGFLS
jgi:hypothetical protein